MDKIKVSDIRAKFPMYQDLTDDQLISGIRQKYYADIPMGKFAGMIDYDTQRDALGSEVTDSLGAGGRFLAGVGKAFTDVARGAGQLTGQVSRDDVRQSRADDRALMNTTGGKIGNFTGNVAAMLPAVLVPGAGALPVAAGIGAATGFLQPSESTGETAKNTAVGAVAGPAGVVLGRGVAATYGALKGLVQPFTKGGQDQIAASTLRQFASDPAKASAAMQSARQLVPGSAPTMAQASGDAGLAQLERTLVNNQETGPQIAAQLAAQRTARLRAVQEVAGTEEFYQGIKEGIRTFAKEDYAKAFQAGFDPKALAANKDQLLSIMSRPSVQQAQAVAKRLAAESGETLNDAGSVKGLDYLVKALDNKISVASNPGSSIGKEELRSLVNTKNDLMGIIEKVAPAYKDARANYAAMSRQASSMDAARGILDRMQSPLGRYGANSSELRNEYARALEAATESVKRSTGLNQPLSAVMPTRDIAALESVALDMGRASAAEGAGIAKGSNTAQNLAAQNMLRRTLGPAGLPQSWAESNALQAFLAPYTGVAKLAGSENAVMNRLGQAALDPQDAARLLMMAQPKVNALMPRALPYANALSLGYAGKQ